MKRSIIAIAVAGCTVGVEYPSPTPPPPWGAPISGGTMAITRDGSRAIVADPDRDRVVIVAFDATRAPVEVALAAGSEPGRVAEDGAGRVHVALRGAGALLTLDAVTGATIARRAACSEPRGVAWDAATDLVHVACTGGELVSFRAGDGEAVRRVVLDRDLRDVIVAGSQLLVTRFRTAELLAVDASGTIARSVTPPIVQRIPGDGSDGPAIEPVAAPASIAWRTIAVGDGRLVMAHQRKVGATLRLSPGGYSPPCGQGLVESAITIVEPDGTPVAVAPLVRGSLPVDVAVDAQVSRFAFVSAGSNSVQVASAGALGQEDTDPCGQTDRSRVRFLSDQLGAPTSVGFRPSGDLVVFYPELPALAIHAVDAPPGDPPRVIQLPGDIGYDAGRALFHRQTAAGIACASCHPEARDDGQVWDFDQLGPRRTQSLAGGILARGPYHWSGDMADLPTLMTNVFGQRMAGGGVTNSERLSLGPWLDRVAAPQPPAPASSDAVARGRELFMSAELGCATCHGGPLYTNNALVDVGTGGVFKVPSLVGVGLRAPLMHDGCAATLRDRFGTCGGGELHGKTAALTVAQLDDLLAFLDSI